MYEAKLLYKIELTIMEIIVALSFTWYYVTYKGINNWSGSREKCTSFTEKSRMLKYKDEV